MLSFLEFLSVSVKKFNIKKQLTATHHIDIIIQPGLPMASSSSSSFPSGVLPILGAATEGGIVDIADDGGDDIAGDIADIENAQVLLRKETAASVKTKNRREQFIDLPEDIGRVHLKGWTLQAVFELLIDGDFVVDELTRPKLPYHNVVFDAKTNIVYAQFTDRAYAIVDIPFQLQLNAATGDGTFFVYAVSSRAQGQHILNDLLQRIATRVTIQQPLTPIRRRARLYTRYPFRFASPADRAFLTTLIHDRVKWPLRTLSTFMMPPNRPIRTGPQPIRKPAQWYENNVLNERHTSPLAVMQLSFRGNITPFYVSMYPNGVQIQNTVNATDIEVAALVLDMWNRLLGRFYRPYIGDYGESDTFKARMAWDKVYSRPAILKRYTRSLQTGVVPPSISPTSSSSTDYIYPGSGTGESKRSQSAERETVRRQNEANLLDAFQAQRNVAFDRQRLKHVITREDFLKLAPVTIDIANIPTNVEETIAVVQSVDPLQPVATLEQFMKSDSVVAPMIPLFDRADDSKNRSKSGSKSASKSASKSGGAKNVKTQWDQAQGRLKKLLQQTTQNWTTPSEYRRFSQPGTHPYPVTRLWSIPKNSRHPFMLLDLVELKAQLVVHESIRDRFAEHGTQMERFRTSRQRRDFWNNVIQQLTTEWETQIYRVDNVLYSRLVLDDITNSANTFTPNDHGRVVDLLLLPLRKWYNDLQMDEDTDDSNDERTRQAVDVHFRSIQPLLDHLTSDPFLRSLRPRSNVTEYRITHQNIIRLIDYQTALRVIEPHIVAAYFGADNDEFAQLASTTYTTLISIISVVVSIYYSNADDSDRGDIKTIRVLNGMIQQRTQSTVDVVRRLLQNKAAWMWDQVNTEVEIVRMLARLPYEVTPYLRPTGRTRKNPSLLPPLLNGDDRVDITMTGVSTSESAPSSSSSSSLSSRRSQTNALSSVSRELSSSRRGTSESLSLVGSTASQRQRTRSRSAAVSGGVGGGVPAGLHLQNLVELPTLNRDRSGSRSRSRSRSKSRSQVLTDYDDTPPQSTDSLRNLTDEEVQQGVADFVTSLDEPESMNEYQQ